MTSARRAERCWRARGRSTRLVRRRWRRSCWRGRSVPRVERSGTAMLSEDDLHHLRHACTLAARGLGDVSPNPPVGAVLVRDGEVVGAGWHHGAGLPHAEVEALSQAGERARGATAYVSLEPCNHYGRTGPCARALAERGVVRVVFGARDPNARAAGGAEYLRGAGIETVDAGLREAQRLIEAFSVAATSSRPYVALKMAAAVNGAIAARGGSRRWLTGEEARALVRALRIEHDAVMVGAGTVRVDDPQLTVRPAHARRVPYRRVVACERDPIPLDRRVLRADEGVETVILAPRARAAAFAELEQAAHVCYVEGEGERLDLAAALDALKSMGIQSVLCEGGPTLAAGLLARGLVDRLHWLTAPALIAGAQAVPSLAASEELDVSGWCFDEVRALGDDAYLSGRLRTEEECSRD
ncbi:bifunctional diaminohydroxyphosphoribosylaminopyrimidine deaminase/5-amino-6-(5-phosphoribosylamino)uracil reductase RibD [bacterium]|nr:MAG: bifunctional diaminohydroxyphosphoribosylaminopyrimidine deaminase/5-amino-6-(5-phosphoribosylamino)uracil reductase RibD [bacterium]